MLVHRGYLYLVPCCGRLVKYTLHYLVCPSACRLKLHCTFLQQIGRHFSKGKRVEKGENGEKVVKQENRRIVDVVMIKDFGPLLNLAATATKLEEERKAADTGKVLTGKKAGRVGFCCQLPYSGHAVQHG